MIQLFRFMLIISLSKFSKSLRAEIDLIYKDSSKNLKILCIPPRNGLNLNNGQDILWYGTHFTSNDQQRLSNELETDILISNIKIKDSNLHRCFLLAPKNILRRFQTLKKRKSRDDSTASVASVPLTEDGICPAGHRINGDRCFPCFPGSYSSGQETECFLCPKDFYMDAKAADSCWPCPERKKTVTEGANSEELCVYLDETGHAVIEQKPPWIAMFVIIGFIILCVWILIIYYCIRYWKTVKAEESAVDEEELLKRRKSSIIKKKRSSEGHLYESISDTDMEEPIYAEIGHFEDEYEEPIKATEPPDYLDLEAPALPPKRKRRETMNSIHDVLSEKMSDDGYEIPIKKDSADFIKNSSDEQYITPYGRRSSSRNDVPKMSSDDQYEVPIRKHSDPNYLDLIDDSEEHFYNEINSDDEIYRGGKDNTNEIYPSNSKDFNSARSSGEKAKRIPSRTIPSRSYESRQHSSENRRQSREM